MIYFARQGLTGNVKIGWTGDVVKRIRGLQTGQHVRLLLMRLFEGEQLQERALHLRFKHLSIGGEWFRFDSAMAADVGLPEIPRPKIGRWHNACNWPATANDYLRMLHAEALQIIGGGDELARRCGVSPVLATLGGAGYIITNTCLAAAAILLAERGRSDITHQMFTDARKADDRDRADDNAKRDALADINNEAAWLRRHPGKSPWWQVYPENKALLEASTLKVAPIDGVVKAEAA